MKLISWNVNGLRAVYRKDNLKDVFEHDPDILCLQETKSSPDQLSPDLKNIKGYTSYFSSSVVKKGYSGVGFYMKKKPDLIKYGMGIEEFDQEGRFIEARYGDLVFLNIYFPNGGQGAVRLEYKLRFYDAFFEYIQELRKQSKSIVFCGDVNTAHEDIDLARPKANEKNTGFLPEERAWLDEIIRNGYSDSFRYKYPNKKEAYTYWDLKMRNRDRNVGWRLDYVFISADLEDSLKKAFILNDIYGSDHCPVGIETEHNL